MHYLIIILALWMSAPTITLNPVRPMRPTTILPKGVCDARGYHLDSKTGQCVYQGTRPN